MNPLLITVFIEATDRAARSANAFIVLGLLGFVLWFGPAARRTKTPRKVYWASAEVMFNKHNSLHARNNPVYEEEDCFTKLPHVQLRHVGCSSQGLHSIGGKLLGRAPFTRLTSNNKCFVGCFI